MSTSSQRHLGAERRRKVAEFLRERRIVRVDELTTALGVSAATVRRDLEVMEQHGQLQRVHGGAVSAEQLLDEPVFDDKAAQAPAEKKAIARTALKLIDSRDSVFLDGGSTALALAGLLQDMNGITVVTNSLRVAGTLSGSGPRLIMIGGELRRLSQTFVGTLTRALADSLRVDKAFMGTIGISETEGLTTTDPREAYTKEIVMAHAGRSILLADSSKIGKVSFVRFASIEDLDVLVTDSGAAPATVRAFRKKGIDVVLA